jgi:hypothetical protein
MQRRINNAKKAFAFTVGKKNISPITVISKRTTIASLEEEIIQAQETTQEKYQREHSELSRSLTTLLPVSLPIKSLPKAEGR